MVARYLLLERAYLREDDHLEASLYEAGSEILFSGKPSRMMEPLNEEGREAMKAISPLNIMGRNLYPRRGDPP